MFSSGRRSPFLSQFLLFLRSPSPLAFPFYLRPPCRFALSLFLPFALLSFLSISHRSVSVPRFGIERVSERNANTSIFNETTEDKENSLTTLMSTTARPKRIYTHRYWPTFRPHGGGFDFLPLRLRVPAFERIYAERRHRRRFSLGRLDYLAGISLKYGMFVLRKNLRYEFAQSSRAEATSQIQTNFKFRLF